jgi:tetratricopeptide (TPR) repeat protein
MGKLDEAIGYHQKNIPNRQHLRDVRGMGQTYYNLGRLYPEKTIESYKKAIENYEKVSPPPFQDICAAYERLGKLFLLLNDFEKAIYYFELSKEKRKELLNSKEEDPHRLANTIGELGHSYLLNGEIVKSIVQYNEMVTIYRLLSKEDFDKFKDSSAERYDNAIRHLKTVLGIFIFKQDEIKIQEISNLINNIKSVK